MLNSNVSVSQCTGCAACSNVCQYSALQMEKKIDGFKYPVIDTKKCIKCKQCLSVCKSRGNIQYQGDALKAPPIYAMRSKNNETRLHSTSGGIFSELAEYILKRKGRVAGAAYKSDWSVAHCMIRDIEELENLRRSKYQQSDIGLIYREVKMMLNEQKEVLFCGTPCQVGGLKAFLGKEYDNLFTCDFICRGVSSPKLFAKYIENLRSTYNSDVEYVWMKNKCDGWHNLTTVVGFENGEKYIKKGLDDTYAQLYLKYNTGIRESCYECQYKDDNDVADITVGDFWGLEGTELDDNLGTSAVICRTQKGAQIVNEIKECVFYQEMQIGDIKRGNPCLCKSIERKVSDTDIFYEILERKGYQQAFEWVEEKINEDEQASYLLGL